MPATATTVSLSKTVDVEMQPDPSRRNSPSVVTEWRLASAADAAVVQTQAESQAQLVLSVGRVVVQGTSSSAHAKNDPIERKT